MFLSLTPRRLETLSTLRRLTEEAGSAVHYSLVATRMKISAWTAYDLLLELEKLGLVVRRYAQETGLSHGGRSRILFSPTAVAPAMSAVGFGATLTAAFERFSAIRDEATAAKAYLASSSEDLAYNMGFWLARLGAAGRQGGEAARMVLEGGTAPLAKAQTVAAMGLGSALARLGASRLTARVTTAAAAFSALLDESDSSSDGRVVELVEASRRLEIG
ncbi:MAG: hypothetical protein NVS9B1_19300 [Candidatus Dormibacteraceae bacterium]